MLFLIQKIYILASGVPESYRKTNFFFFFFGTFFLLLLGVQTQIPVIGENFYINIFIIHNATNQNTENVKGKIFCIFE